MTIGHHFYWSGPFSQWQICQIELWGQSFNCAEQAMMYAKAILFKDEATAGLILSATDPGKQKALGRQISNFDDATWDGRKFEIVHDINVAKFDQNKGLRRKLFQTAPKALVEASPLDCIWGIGLDAQTAAITPETEWPGQNLLGQALTQVRAELTKRYPDEAATCLRDNVETET